MKENSREETIKIIERKIKEAERYSDITGLCLTLDEEFRNALMNILSDYKRVLKENERLKKSNQCYINSIQAITPVLSQDYIEKQKVKDKIEEAQKEYNKLDKQVDEYINDANKDLAKYYENKEKISIMQTLSYFIDTLQELLEGRK